MEYIEYFKYMRHIGYKRDISGIFLGIHVLQDSKSKGIPVDNFGTVVGENPSCYGILPLWAVNGLSIVCWDW